MNAKYFWDPAVPPVILEVFADNGDGTVELGRRNVPVTNAKGETTIVEKYLVVGRCPKLARAGEEGYCVILDEPAVVVSGKK